MTTRRLALSMLTVCAAWPVAAVAKSNASGLTLRADAPAALKVGQTARLRLHINGARAADARVALRSDSPGLQLSVRAQPAGAAVPLAPGFAQTLEVEATAQAAGRHVVVVTLTQQGRSSVTAVVLDAGGDVGTALKRDGPIVTTPQGERLVALPAASP